MAFSREFNTIIESSNGEISEISYVDGMELINYSSDNSILRRKKLNNFKKAFSTSHFNIDEKNNIYAVILEPENTLTYLYITDKYLYKSKIFSFDSSKYEINFPYIKKFNNTIHLFYYLLPISTPNSCKLIHCYNTGQGWEKHDLDSINYFILTNFSVVFDSNSPSIFYINNINGCDEVIFSTFHCKEMLWSPLITITSSEKSKVYLSVIQDESKNYHIVFSENNDDKYHCAYTSGYVEDAMFYITKDSILKETIACEFPTISLIKGTLHCQWLEYNNLYTSESKDNGTNWSKSRELEESRDNWFLRYDYVSNKSSNYNFILNNFFAYKNELQPLAFGKNIL